MEKPVQRIKLEFDKRTHPYGSKEHFWHFLLGYLLPSIHFYFKSKKVGNDNIGIHLEYHDCGPLMNPMIKEIADLMGIPFSISSTNDQQTQVVHKTVYLPRWDIRLVTSIYFVIYNGRYNSNIRIEKKDIIRFIKKNLSFRQKAFGINLRRDILFVRNLILDKVNNDTRPESGPYLFLDRSDAHSFYGAEGKAEIKGYGKSRRALINLEEGCKGFNEAGIHAEVFKPGSYSLLHQIKTFNNAQGVIAIRGAELANLMWMKPQSKIFVVGFMDPAFHLYNYACLLNLKLSERSCDADYPDIKAYDIKNLLNI